MNGSVAWDTGDTEMKDYYSRSTSSLCIVTPSRRLDFVDRLPTHGGRRTRSIRASLSGAED